MPTFPDSLVGQKLMWSFNGHTPPPDFLAALAAGQVSGLTLSRSLNFDRPAQILELSGALKRAARDDMKFGGVVISDAMDMRAIQQGQLPCTGQLPVEVP